MQYVPYYDLYVVGLSISCGFKKMLVDVLYISMKKWCKSGFGVLEQFVTC